MQKFKPKDLHIEELNEKHLKIIKQFSSYEKELVDFLLEDAYNNQKLQISKTFLFFDNKHSLVSYITLLNDSINLEGSLKEFFREKEIHYRSLPSLKIGRLCVDDNYLKKGIGTIMIKFAVNIGNQIETKYSGCRFITLDAKRNNDPKRDPLHFYKKLGFKILKDRKKGTIPMYFDMKIN
jgi:ribosomal protein S18 acetylase RimI-like enzyme